MQDLEYQVQLRLRIHPLYGYFKQHPTVIQPHLLELKKRAVTSLENLKQTKEGNSRLHAAVEQKSHLEDEDINTTALNKHKCELEMAPGKNSSEQVNNGEGREAQSKTEVQNKTDGRSKVEGKSNQNKTEGQTEVSGDQFKRECQIQATEEIELSGAFYYVNVKYGTPNTQLRNLLEKGCYEAVLVDTSGVGSGPKIKCPVEAHVYLPTPTHKVCEQPNPLNKSCIVAATGDFAPVSGIGQTYRNQPKLVYASGNETKTGPAGSLQFESRFESGNLMQAFQT